MTKHIQHIETNHGHDSVTVTATPVNEDDGVYFNSVEIELAGRDPTTVSIRFLEHRDVRAIGQALIEAANYLAPEPVRSLPWWKILADNWRGRNGNSTTGDSVRNSCADELEKVATRYGTAPQTLSREQIVAVLITKSMLNTIEATQLQAEQQADALLALLRQDHPTPSVPEPMRPALADDELFTLTCLVEHLRSVVDPDDEVRKERRAENSFRYASKLADIVKRCSVTN
jgi:hypothetical protein